MGGLELSRLGRPCPLQLQESEPTSAADHGEGGDGRSNQNAPLAHSAVLAGADEVAQLRAELIAPFSQPGPAPDELQAAEECFWLIGSRCRLPLAQILLQLLTTEQEIAGLIQPAAQQRPYPQQCFVSNLHCAAMTLALALHQQAGCHQSLQHGPCSLRQVVPGGGAAGVAALLAHPNHPPTDKRLPQRFQARLIRPLCLKHPIGGLLHRILQRRKAGGRISQGLVIAQGEHPIGAVLLVQLPQGEGQQGQGVFSGSVVDGPVHKRWLHLQASHPGRAFDDLPVAIQGEWPQRQGVEGVHQRRQRLQGTHGIGPDRHHRLKRQGRLQHRRQHGHKPLPLCCLGHRE